MAYCYCYTRGCDEFDLPAWFVPVPVIPMQSPPQVVKNPSCGKQCSTACAACPPCSTCGGDTHVRPNVPLPVQRFQSPEQGSDVERAPLVGIRRASLFYCQNPNQSGDTTGMGMSLSLFDEMGILFFVSFDRAADARAFLTYYADMGATPDRVVLIVGDEEALPEKEQKQRTEDRAKEELGKFQQDAADAKQRFEEAEKRKLSSSMQSSNTNANLRLKVEWEEKQKLVTLTEKKEQKLKEAASTNEATLEKDFGEGKKTYEANTQAQTQLSTATSLSDMTIDAFFNLLLQKGWPKSPLLVPPKLVPSRIKVQKVNPWHMVDPTTALDVIRSESDDQDAALHQYATDRFWLQTTLDGAETGIEPYFEAYRLDLRQHALQKRADELLPRRSDSVTGAVKKHSALWPNAKQTGCRLPELLSALRVAGGYRLYQFRINIGKEPPATFLVIAGYEGEASLAFTGETAFCTLKMEVVEAPVQLGAFAQTPLQDAKRKKRFNFAKDLLLIRLTRRNAKACSFQSRYDAALVKIDETPAKGASNLRALAGRITPWTYWDERSGNQLYQSLTEFAIKLRDEQVAANAVPLEGRQNAYQTLMKIPAHQYFPIGDTSRNILAKLQKDGLVSLTAKLAITLKPGCSIVGPALKKKFMDGFLARHEEAAKGRRKTLVLIWVRGVNQKEARKVKTTYQPQQIVESIAKQLDSLKRNPHHVMTSQLCLQLIMLFKHFNEAQEGRFVSPDQKRFFIPVPIGDRVFLDQYHPPDPITARETGSKAIVDMHEDNMIDLWERQGETGLNEEVGGPHWRYRQVCMMRELFLDGRFDVIQIGIRSGALEQGMYQGVPTIYLEEEFCATGDRMASLTTHGPQRALMDKLLREIQSSKEFLQDIQTKAPYLSAFRRCLDWALAQPGEQERDSQLSQEAVEKWLSNAAVKCGVLNDKRTDQILEHVRHILERPRYDMRSLAPDLDEPRDDVFPPDPSPNRRGFPHFYRLIMKHLVGLNQPRNEDQLRDYLQYMHTSIKKSAPGEEPTKPPDDRVYRGGLQLEELDLLRLYCGQICRGYEVLRENVSK